VERSERRRGSYLARYARSSVTTPASLAQDLAGKFFRLPADRDLRDVGLSLDVEEPFLGVGVVDDHRSSSTELVQPGVQALVRLGAVGHPGAATPQEPEHPGGVVSLVLLLDSPGQLLDVLLRSAGLAGAEERGGHGAAADWVASATGDLVSNLLVGHTAVDHLA